MSTHYMEGAQWRTFNDGTEAVEWTYGLIEPLPEGTVRVLLDGGWESESLYLDRDDLGLLRALLRQAAERMGWE